VPYPPDSSTTNIFLPAPGNPATHIAFYTAIMQFCIGIGILQITILALRLSMRSPIGKTTETVGNLIFWFGAAFLITTLLSTGTLQGWFEYWSALIILIGVTVIVRGVILMAAKKR